MREGRKRVLLFSYTSDDWENYQRLLEPIFEGEEIQLVLGAFSAQEHIDWNIDLALVTSRFFAPYVEEKCGSGTPVLWLNHTLERKTFHLLEGLSKRGKISVASDALFYSEERRNMLINLGISQHCLVPWYPGMGEEELEENVVAFERTAVPAQEHRNVYRVEGRGFIAVDTMFHICLSLKRLDLMQKSAMKSYLENICHNVRHAREILNIGDYVQTQITGAGLLMFFWPNPTVYYCDHNALLLLGLDERVVVGKTIYELFPFLKSETETGLLHLKEKVVNVKNKKMVFRLQMLPTHNLYVGIIVISGYRDEVQKELRLRRQVMDKKHVAKYTFQSICGESPILLACKESAKKMAKSDANVVIAGPSGAGKELFAQAIHNASRRRNYPFISVNCGAIVDTLLESELFGYESGAFTGARKEGKTGLFELAHRGTLFLDEIAEMPPALQVKLLRVLQEGEVVRVGGHEVIPVDVRIIAATNRNLRQMVRDGQFRLDLFYRLNVLPLNVPGLNDRREDIMMLVKSFLKQLNSHFELLPEAKEIMIQHNYEGNVRELQNCVEYLVSLGGAEIRVEDLPPYMLEGRHSSHTSTVKDDDKEKVLSAISNINRMGLRAGRRSICQYLKNQGEWISEAKIRKILRQLEEEEKIQSGRGGAVLKDGDEESQ